MGFVFYSITGSFESFHRKREIEALLDRDMTCKAIYFTSPRFFLKNIFNNLKSDKSTEIEYENIKVLSLNTLLPLKLCFNNRALVYLFVSLPIKIQAYFAQKRYLETGKVVNWFYKPDQLYYIKSNNEYVYLHYDNYKADVNYTFSKSKNFDSALEKCIIDSRLTLFSSSKLYKQFKALSNNVFYYPNAISKTLINDEISIANDSKVIGFIGQLDGTFDFDLIKKIANEFDSYSIVLIGPEKDKEAVKSLEGIGNILLLGYMDYSKLSENLKGFDLGICPYKNSEFNKYRNPLKIIEYFSYGIPVVTVKCDISDEVSELVSVAEEHEDFIKAIELQLSQDTIEKKYARQNVAKANCWENRAEFVIKQLKKF